MRLAGAQDIIRKLAAQGVFQDAREIAAVSALLGLGQYAAGANPEDIAIAALAGAGVSAAVKPVAAMAGRRMGRFMDNHPMAVHPRGQQFHEGFMGSIEGSRTDMINRMNRGELDTPAGQRALEKYKVNYSDGERIRGLMEGDVGLIARRYGDNVAQALVQTSMPGLIPEPQPAE